MTDREQIIKLYENLILAWEEASRIAWLHFWNGGGYQHDADSADDNLAFARKGLSEFLTR